MLPKCPGKQLRQPRNKQLVVIQAMQSMHVYKHDHWSELVYRTLAKVSQASLGKSETCRSWLSNQIYKQYES